MFQSFNFRGRDKMKPFYDLIANIAAEEYGHIELVSHTSNMLLTGVARDASPFASTRTQTACTRHQPVRPFFL
jgi:Mn-containing catalase